MVLVKKATSIEQFWIDLKNNHEVIANSIQIDSLNDYIKTLSNEEQDEYYSNFRSLYSPKMSYGLYSQNYICSLNTIV